MANFAQCDFEPNHIPHAFTAPGDHYFVCPGRSHTSWQDRAWELMPIGLVLVALAVALAVMLALAPTFGVCT